jgi:hypothetical protein
LLTRKAAAGTTWQGSIKKFANAHTVVRGEPPMYTDTQQEELYALVVAQRCLLEAMLQRQAAMGSGALDDVHCRARYLLRETSVPGLTPAQLDSLRRRAGLCLDEIDERSRLLTV